MLSCIKRNLLLVPEKSVSEPNPKEIKLRVQSVFSNTVILLGLSRVEGMSFPGGQRLITALTDSWLYQGN